MAWALIFAVAKRTGIEDRVIRAGGWQTGFPVSLAARRSASSAPAASAAPWSPSPGRWAWTSSRGAEPHPGALRRARHSEGQQGQAPVLCRRPRVFLVFSERSRNTLRAGDFAQLKPGAILVNISRGPIVEEAALIAALRSGHLAGAGLDVFDREPLPADHPFRSLDNVVVTPHTGYVTEQGFRTAWPRMAENVAAYLAGSPIRVVSDPADCPPMAPQ